MIVPLTSVNKKANTPVSITFLEEDLPTDEINLIKDMAEKYQMLAKSYHFGAKPDADYAKELMAYW